MRYVFDIETDGLLHTCTTCWIIHFVDIDTKNTFTYLPHKDETGWQELMSNASLIVGHNILNFDLPVLEKLYKFRLPPTVTVHDTLLMSQILDFNRFGKDGHSMARWGEHLGHNKVEHEDWSKYTEEMLFRCTEDVQINLKMYEQLIEEAKALIAKVPRFATYLRAEHYVAEFAGRAELLGWNFDREAGLRLFQMMGREIEVAERKLKPLLGKKVVVRDKLNGEPIVKYPRWTKDGLYTHYTAKDFGKEIWEGLNDERAFSTDPEEGGYVRIEIRDLELPSIQDVKLWLSRNGWRPTDFNYKKELNLRTGRYENKRMSPKITLDSLEFLGSNGQIYSDYLTTKSRYNILKTWLQNITEQDRLHGSTFVIGTPSMRVTHKAIVNVPSAGQKTITFKDGDDEWTRDVGWGCEMRKLFIAKPGWKIVGCDSSGNQARGLAHYLKSAEYINILLNEDIHTYNKEISNKVLMTIDADVSIDRSVAKRILYAFLFGASGAKLWAYITGIMDPINGNKFKAAFTRAVPGFKNLLDKLNDIYEKTKRSSGGYIPSIAGNRIYVDSRHKLLVYLLQSCEKVTCAAATMLTMQGLEAENIPYEPCIFYHDEIDFIVPEQYAERAKEIGIKAFAEGPKMFGIEIMAGEGKIGDNWLDVH